MAAKGKEKMVRFTPLAEAAAIAFANGRRPAKPLVVPFVMSSRGSINPDGMDLVKKLAGLAAHTPPALGLGADGADPVKRARILYNRLLDKIMVCHARGVGRVLASATGFGPN